jgi:hypothetical protein
MTHSHTPHLNNTFVGVTQVNWQDGTSSGYATWNR